MYEMTDGIDGLIGNTPILRLKKIEEKYALKARLFAKLEYFNPGGSIKDRVAKAMIDEAEKTGALKNGGSVIEATSGNTGIGLALVAAARGYKAVIVMPDTMSVERQKLMKAYGAELVLTDGKKGMSGAVEKAEEILKNTPNAIIAGQFDNPANPKAHYTTTGPEIFTQTKGEVDIFVAGIGTGGTLSGTGKYLKEQKPSIQVVGIEPASSPLITKGVAGAHAIQGIGANFMPKNYDSSVCDEIVTVENQAAINAAREVGQTEGAFVGISSGAALWAAIEVGKRPENEGKTIVVILPDGGDRYLSTALVE